MCTVLQHKWLLLATTAALLDAGTQMAFAHVWSHRLKPNQIHHKQKRFVNCLIQGSNILRRNFWLMLRIIWFISWTVTVTFSTCKNRECPLHKELEEHVLNFKMDWQLTVYWSVSVRLPSVTQLKWHLKRYKRKKKVEDSIQQIDYIIGNYILYINCRIWSLQVLRSIVTCNAFYWIFMTFIYEIYCICIGCNCMGLCLQMHSSSKC